MTEGSFSDADINRLADALAPRLIPKLVPEIEEALSQRFFASAGRGLIVGSWLNIVRPILIALAIFGLASLARNPSFLSHAITTAQKSGG